VSGRPVALDSFLLTGHEPAGRPVLCSGNAGRRAAPPLGGSISVSALFRSLAPSHSGVATDSEDALNFSRRVTPVKAILKSNIDLPDSVVWEDVPSAQHVSRHQQRRQSGLFSIPFLPIIFLSSQPGAALASRPACESDAPVARVPFTSVRFTRGSWLARNCAACSWFEQTVKAAAAGRADSDKFVRAVVDHLFDGSKPIGCIEVGILLKQETGRG
jgi:hypothetical protein